MRSPGRVTQDILNAVHCVIQPSQRQHRNGVGINIVRRKIHCESEFVIINVWFTVENRVRGRPIQKIKTQIYPSVSMFAYRS